MEVITIQSEAYKTLINQIGEIQSAVKANSRRQPLAVQWLDISETCQLLKISKRTLQSYRDNRILPFSQIGGKIYFSTADIEAHLQRNYISK